MKRAQALVDMLSSAISNAGGHLLRDSIVYIAKYRSKETCMYV